MSPVLIHDGIAYDLATGVPTDLEPDQMADRADEREARYWTDHPRVTEALAICAPEATTDLIDMIRTGATPTIGWWNRRLPAGRYLPGTPTAPAESDLVPV